MVKACKCSMNIAFHCNVNVTRVIVPVKIEAAIFRACPINGDVVIVFERVNEMLGIGFGEIFDAKVVNAKGECGGSRGMFPKARGEFDGFVAKRFEVLDKVIESDETCFFEAIQAFAHFKIDVAIVVDLKLVFGKNFLRDGCSQNADIMVEGKWGA